MIRSFLKKIFRPWSKKSSERMDETRDQAHDRADELTPGHSDKAGQIGVFH